MGTGSSRHEEERRPGGESRSLANLRPATTPRQRRPRQCSGGARAGGLFLAKSEDAGQSVGTGSALQWRPGGEDSRLARCVRVCVTVYVSARLAVSACGVCVIIYVSA